MKISSARAQPSPSPELGLRERSKQDKLRRIKQAAREIFLEKGYDAATTREIAQRADVAIGTVFVYAEDKRDLLMMIVNADLDAVNDKGARVLQQDGALIDLLMAFFGLRYKYWARHPQISRPAVQATSDFLAASVDRGEETQRFYARRANIYAMLGEVVRRKQERGEIGSDASPELIAALFVTIYLAEVRRWLSQAAPKPAGGLATLRALLELAIRGLAPVGRELTAMGMGD
ncbi:putative DNA-binding transcriptional regulator [Pigmentiphaga humi]|uniref:Putative DNA-binding transcriptional regulator n=1 Tax=Pigmentiphaga humi TaxID=2478468 RepID=A0A3P4B407_9BURK|nr:TetR/AcrR family transcriptional regulator [Pigmentiphaga humi]VCU70368.1 putative DNA-binding transcriptional regulator [Pigmentiphaga humi]